MNNFERKWQDCAARARQVPQPDDSIPHGFATRVVALAWQSSSGSLELVWQRLTWRCLGLTLAVLIICAALEIPSSLERPTLNPGVENAVAQLVWSL
jgi:hypothetical protein